VKTSTFILWNCFFVMGVQQLAAQPVGSPALTNSHREFTLSFSGGYVKKEIFGVENQSTRFLAKGMLGFANQFDIFFEIGAANLTLEMSGAAPLNLEDKYRLALGGGFTLRYLRIQPAQTSFFLKGQIFRTTSQPSALTTTTLSGVPVTQSLVLKYDWREAIFSTGLVKEIGVMNLFAGARGSLTQRLETKISSTGIAGDSGSEIRETGEYRSGLQTQPFLGVEFKLPARYLFSCEISGRSASDFAFYLGISQTGKP
jgi:hypothetical protein